MASFNVIAPTPYSNQCQSLTSYDGGVILAQLDDNTNRYN